MERYLVTQSLLSAWLYTFDCFEGCEDDAHADFLRTLNREKGEPTEAMLNGIRFENLCYSIAKGAFHTEWKPSGHTNPSTGEVLGYDKYPDGYAGASQIAAIIADASFQVKAKRELEADGMSFLVYGILDALKAGTIYDVKFVNKKFGGLELAGKYLDSAQHPAYFFIVPEATEFKYLVSDGEDIYIEQYRREETRPIEDIISGFIESLRVMGLLDLYKEKWLAL